MTLGPWTYPGSHAPIRDAWNHGWYCHGCPCAPCLKAIEQRQKAKGITTAWSAGDPTNVARLIDTTGGTAYTLTQLKAYVNALCAGTSGCFIAGPYTGGVSAPTWLASTYANSATTVDELCALVAAMVYTRRAVGFSTRAGKQFGQDSTDRIPLATPPDYSGIEAIIDAGFPGSSANYSSIWLDRYVGTKADGSNYVTFAARVWHGGKCSIGSLDTTISHAVNLYGYADWYDAYSYDYFVYQFEDFGLGLAYQEYGLLKAWAATLDATLTADPILEIPTSTDWTSWAASEAADPGPHANYWSFGDLGCIIDSGIAVIEWDFTE